MSSTLYEPLNDFAGICIDSELGAEIKAFGYNYSAMNHARRRTHDRSTFVNGINMQYFDHVFKRPVFITDKNTIVTTGNCTVINTSNDKLTTVSRLVFTPPLTDLNCVYVQDEITPCYPFHLKDAALYHKDLQMYVQHIMFLIDIVPYHNVNQEDTMSVFSIAIEACADHFGTNTLWGETIAALDKNYPRKTRVHQMHKFIESIKPYWGTYFGTTDDPTAIEHKFAHKPFVAPEVISECFQKIAECYNAVTHANYPVPHAITPVVQTARSDTVQQTYFNHLLDRNVQITSLLQLLGSVFLSYITVHAVVHSAHKHVIQPGEYMTICIYKPDDVVAVVL